MLQQVIILSIVALAGLANLFLAIYVYNKNAEAKVNAAFFYFGLSLFLWCSANFMSLLTKDLFWLRSTYAIGSFVPLAGTFFTYALANKKINKWFGISLSVICTAFFFIDLFTPLLVTKLISYTQFGFNVIPGPVFNVWGIFLLLAMVYTVSVPLGVLKTVDKQRKNQILYFLTGDATCAGWIILVTVILPALGIFKFINLDSPSSFFVVGFTSYSIIKFNLLGIKSLLFKVFIYTTIIMGIIIILLLLMFTGSSLLAQSMIWPIYVIAIVTAVVLFFIGRLFFDERRDLENAKISLTESLEISEKNRILAETERDKTGTIINSFSDGLIIVDEKNNIFSINPEAGKILELESNSLSNKPLLSLADFPKSAPIASALSNGLKNIFKNEINLAKDFVIELSVIPLKLNEKDIGHLIVLHDISREKMVENMKTDFVSLVAHQLRTPLTAVNWSMGMLKKGEFGKLSEKQEEVVGNTLSSNEKLISLVNNILNITRIEGGKYLSETEMADLKEIIDSAIDSYKTQAEKKKISIEFKEPSDFPQIMIDAEKIKIVVQNVIDNAIKYSPEGGKIIITLKNDDKNIEFRTQDFGIGIPKSQKDNIFTKFFRGDNAERVDPNGTGLGLFLSANIIEAHGGKIWFESEGDIGTSVCFSLPRGRF